MSAFLEWRLRVRDAGNTTDVFTVSSVRGDTLPFLIDPPSGDGAEFDPLTGSYRSGSLTFRIADGITSGTSRVITSQMEDASFRQQLGGRPAYGDLRVDGGAWTAMQAGIITSIRLTSPAVWEVDVGDTTRATRNLTAFGPKRNPINATIVEPLATYLARWPQRGCLAGGPIIGGFLGVQDRGGWEMTIAESFTLASGKILKRLEFVSGYAPPGFGRTTSASAVADSLNKAMGDHNGPPVPTSFPADLEPSSWPDVVVQIGTRLHSPASVLDVNSAGIISGPVSPGPQFMGTNHGLHGFLVWDSTNALAVGSTVFRVRVFDALPSDRSPIYVTGHPVAHWTTLCDEAGLTYDSTAVTATTNAIGQDRRLSLRITGVQSWSSFVESTLYGPTGFSVRTNVAGALEPFTTRILTATAPTRTITSADVPQDVSALFNLSAPDAITKVTFTQQNLIPSTEQSGDADSGSPDGVIVQSVSVIRTSGDGGGTVDREQSYSIPGFYHTASTTTYSPALVDALAFEIFDRQGRGRVDGEVLLTRGGAGDGAVLGDEMIVALPQMPNHNKRLGDDGSVAGRVVQIVRMTPSARGQMVRFLDSGASAQTLPTVPTLSVALGYAANVVTATVTNAATLNAAGYGLRLQWAATTGGAPATGQYTDVAAYLPGQIPTTAITLPPTAPGQTVYVRARSELAGTRPSNYGTAVSLGTTAFSAPTSLAATPSGSDGSQCALAWAIGSGASACFSDVFVRKTADPASADVCRAQLIAGSVAYTLTDLTPGVGYTASVRHRDGLGSVSTKTTVAFTAGATTITLTAPTAPAGIVGRTLASGVPVLDGTYGLDVFATVIPGLVEYWEGVETGVGSGSYGTPALIATRASVSGDVTGFRAVAPNDRLRRSLTARHVGQGVTGSGFTTAVIVSPWGAIVGPNVNGGYTLSVPTATAVYGTPGTLTVVFTNSGFPSGTTYDLAWSVDGGSSGTSTGITSGVVITTNLGSGASGKVEISANYAGMILSQKKYWGVFPT